MYSTGCGGSAQAVPHASRRLNPANPNGGAESRWRLGSASRGFHTTSAARRQPTTSLRSAMPRGEFTSHCDQRTAKGLLRTHSTTASSEPADLRKNLNNSSLSFPTSSGKSTRPWKWRSSSRLGRRQKKWNRSARASTETLMNDDPSTWSPGPFTQEANKTEKGNSSRGGVFGPERRWPDPLSPQAFYGLAGDIVRAIEPHTEADPAALLGQFLVAFGNASGAPSPFTVEAPRHACNLFIALVGVTSKARKGSAWNRILQLMEQADPEWVSKRILSGLSS